MVEMKHAEPRIRILLCGGIGSGKSVAGRRFQQLGATVIEADRIGHAVLHPDGEAFAAVSERWPAAVVGNRIDRGLLADIVFADPEQLTELEALTHRPIIRRISELALITDDLVVEIPLILDVPGNWIRVLIDADEDIRLRRAVERGAAETDVKNRISSQPSRDEWLSWCDVSVKNNGPIEDLYEQIDALWHGRRTTDYGLRP
ncbi:MAG: dephospho-CoA kinase [Actinomycetota bacterium]|nr:dephospho-CoA kinase [Actinomycetota bacterium]